MGLNKTQLPWLLPLLFFFTACYTFVARFCYFTFWCDRFLDKLLRILRVHEGSSYSLDLSGQLILLNMFFFCIFLQPVVTESWMVWKIFSIVPVRWQSGTMDKDPNGQKLGTPPYGHLVGKTKLLWSDSSYIRRVLAPILKVRRDQLWHSPLLHQMTFQCSHSIRHTSQFCNVQQEVSCPEGKAGHRK